MKKKASAEENTNDEVNSSKDSVQDWLEEALVQLDTDFPLSGAETEKDLEDTDQANDDISDREHLDTNFPLSGGV